MAQATRREWMAMAAGAALGATAGAAYRATSAQRSTKPPLRPPGAKDEAHFLAACIRCGQCVQACPFDTLKLAGLGAGASHGSPCVTPTDVPCYLCQEYDQPQCIRVCPTDALSPVGDLLNVRMGTAVVDASICLPFNGASCRACWHACPFPDKAVILDERLRPVVVEDVCVGCGLCEHACPTDPRSIVIQPPEAVA